MRRDDYVAADRALAHVDRLVADHPGLTKAHVARLAGLTAMPLAARQGGRTVTRDTEERLLAVTDRHVALVPPFHVPREPVLRHLDMLMEAVEFASLNRIGKVAGISYQTMYNLRSGVSRTCRWTTYTALMAVTPEALAADCRFRPLGPTLTRLRALQANGWSRNALDAVLGKVVISGVLTRNTSGTVTPAMEAQVRAIYERIGDTPGPSRNAANRARRLGYMPPIYYDDDMRLIEVEEDEDVEEQQRARDALCILALTLEGQAITQIAAMLGIPTRRVTRVRARHGVTMARAIIGGFEPVERWEGQFAAIRAAVRGVHYHSTLDVLDAPGTDYMALLAEVSPEADQAAA